MLICATQAHAHAPDKHVKVQTIQKASYSVRQHQATHNCEFVEAQHVHHAHLHAHWSEISAVHAIVLHNAAAVGASSSLPKHAISGLLTWASTAANRSGRWLAHAATSRPPFDPPCSTHHRLHGQQHPQEDLASSSGRCAGLARGDSMQQPGKQARNPVMRLSKCSIFNHALCAVVKLVLTWMVVVAGLL